MLEDRLFLEAEKYGLDTRPLQGAELERENAKRAMKFCFFPTPSECGEQGLNGSAENIGMESVVGGEKTGM